MNGVIKMVDKDRGFGFIAGDDGKDYFFHLSAVKRPQFLDLEIKDKVEFSASKGPRGLRADHVTGE